MNATPDENKNKNRMEVHGSGLAPLIDEVNRRGGRVEGMTTKKPGVYQLHVFWPPGKQFDLPIEHEHGMGF
jgi:hypothetical protein